jgi:hypothetical protein
MAPKPAGMGSGRGAGGQGGEGRFATQRR